MKIILLQDVKGIGRKYDVKNVADGYALNMLIPRKMAEIASPSAMSKLELLKKQNVEKEKIQIELLDKAIKSISGKSIELNEKANEKGHLFAAIHQAEIAKMLNEKYHFNVNTENILIDAPIKEIGDHKIKIKVGEKTAEIIVTVKASK